MKSSSRSLEEALNPNKLKIRDRLLVRLINGATKAGVHKDRKKEANRRACRKKGGWCDEG